ncbi:MAG: metallophosphatase family protein [Bacteroidales bacterium]|nr:metallophosphatase family protein [Bacteroidales bacterium]
MRIAVISDIHEDIVSLQLALKKIDKAGCDEVVCLGDIAGFSIAHYNYHHHRNGHECMKLLRKHCKIIIPGNHDLAAVKRIPSVTRHFQFPDDWHDMAYVEKKFLAEGKVWLHEENELQPLFSKKDIDFINTLPEYRIMTVDDHHILFSHYLYPNITGMEIHFVETPEAMQAHFDFMEQQQCTISFTGHAHQPGIFMASRGKIIKPGFGKKKITANPICIASPAIANGRNSNGFLIFDSEKQQVDFKRL